MTGKDLFGFGHELSELWTSFIRLRKALTLTIRRRFAQSEGKKGYFIFSNFFS